MDEVQAAEVPRASRISAAALLLGASVLLSRVLGYAREALLAYRVGAGASTDAYYAAFQIPDLLNYLLAGGALSIAFIPLYTAHLAAGDDTAADHLLSTVLGTYLSYHFDASTGGMIVVVLSVLFVLAYAFSPRHGLLARR